MEPLEITCPTWFDDAEMFEGIINQGIDSYLEGFTKSRFHIKGDRLFLSFHPDEVPLLLRRLLELNDDHADQWVYDIVFSQYGRELE